MNARARAAGRLADLSIGAKLYAMVGLLLGALALAGVLSIVSLSSSASDGSRMFSNATRPIEQLEAVETSLGNLASDQTNAVVATRARAQARSAHAFRSDAAALSRSFAAYRGSGLAGVELATADRFEAGWERYRQIGGSVLGLALAGSARHAAASALYFSRSAPLNSTLDRALAKLVAINGAQASSDIAAVRSDKSSGETLTIIVLIAALLLGSGIAVLVTNSIRLRVGVVLERMRSLRDHCAAELRAGIEALANGDLTVPVTAATKPIPNPGGDEIGKIAEAVNAIGERFAATIDAYNETRQNLGGLISEVSVSAGSVSAASQEIAGTSEQAGRANIEIAGAVEDIASGAQRTAHMVAEARLAAEDVARAVAETAANAQATATVAHRAREVAQEGVGAAERANGAMGAVRDSTMAASAAIRELASKSEQIGAIVETITGIAAQTNLLALNAAIEAARAGEQGRGFAVVAEEVRKLAEESEHAAHEISELIDAIQGETSNAVTVVERGARQTEDGAHVVNHTRDAFLHIDLAFQDMTSRIEQIATAADQIAASADTMQSNIGEVAALAQQSSASTQEVSASTQQATASSEEIAASAQELSANAELLNRLVAQFQTAVE